jgi:hypothetical protein
LTKESTEGWSVNSYPADTWQDVYVIRIHDFKNVPYMSYVQLEQQLAYFQQKGLVFIQAGNERITNYELL